jgi:hypothetical protein
MSTKNVSDHIGKRTHDLQTWWYRASTDCATMYPNSFCYIHLILAPFLKELTEEEKNVWLLHAEQLCDPASNDIVSGHLTTYRVWPPRYPDSHSCNYYFQQTMKDRVM